MRMLAQWCALFLARLILIIVGYLAVSIGVFFTRPDYSVSDGRVIVNMPRWLWLWGNDFDGLQGDKRGWWAANTPFGWPVTSRCAMWWWGAVRNPANNMRRLDYFSCPISDCVITYKGDAVVEDKSGMGGRQLVIATKGHRRWYGFYWVVELTDTRALVIRLGFKIKPEHQGAAEEPKGFTFKINPWKAI